MDAGGGTIDLSAYHLKKKTNELEEISPATCSFHPSRSETATTVLQVISKAPFMSLAALGCFWKVRNDESSVSISLTFVVQTNYMIRDTALPMILTISQSASTEQPNWHLETQIKSRSSSSGRCGTQTRQSMSSSVNSSCKGQLVVIAPVKIDLIVRYPQIGCSKILRAKYCCRQDGDPAAGTCCPCTHQGKPCTTFLVVSQSDFNVQSVLLVGGFAASNWLFHELQTHLAGTGLRLYRPDGHLYV